MGAVKIMSDSSKQFPGFHQNNAKFNRCSSKMAKLGAWWVQDKELMELILQSGTNKAFQKRAQWDEVVKIVPVKTSNGGKSDCDIRFLFHVLIWGYDLIGPHRTDIFFCWHFLCLHWHRRNVIFTCFIRCTLFAFTVTPISFDLSQYSAKWKCALKQVAGKRSLCR